MAEVRALFTSPPAPPFLVPDVDTFSPSSVHPACTRLLVSIDLLFPISICGEGNPIQQHALAGVSMMLQLGSLPAPQ